MPPAPYIKIPWKESFQGIFICRITPGPRRVLPPRPPLKPRRVLPAAAGKMESESVFPQDICLGKNSSQPASVERTRRRCVRSARGGLPSLLAKTAGPFLRIYSTTPRQRRNLPAGKLGASRAASSGGNPFPPEAPQGLPAGTGVLPEQNPHIYSTTPRPSNVTGGLLFDLGFYHSGYLRFL